MSTKEGLTEDEYLAIVERLQRAMMIEPFRPDVTDVVMLIGTWRVQQREIERLSRRLEWHEAMTQEVERLNAENERLRAELEQALTTDHSKRGCCEWHILNGKPWIPPPTSVLQA